MFSTDSIRKCEMVLIQLLVFLHRDLLFCKMAEGGEEVEWELSKENIQPLRRGRHITALQEALTQHQDGFSSAIIQQRQYVHTVIHSFEIEE